MESIDEILNSFPEKKNNFKVPENYFEDFPLKLQHKLQKNVKYSFKEFFNFFLKPKFAYIASIIIFIFVIYNVNNKKFTRNTAITDQEVCDIIQHCSNEVEEDEIIEFIVNENTKAQNSKEGHSTKKLQINEEESQNE